MRKNEYKSSRVLMVIYENTGGAQGESEDNFSMHRVQAEKLQLNEKQKERPRQIRNEEILQIL